jgi:hypothetical protein
MSNSDLATLKVRSAHDAIEVSVLDGSFGIVAQGTGNVEAQLSPGIYELELRLGPALERRLLKLQPGETHEERAQLADPNLPTDPEAMRLAVPSAAPVDGTSTTREEHMHAAFQASSALRRSRGRAGVVLMVRTLRGSKVSFTRKLVDLVALVDAEQRPLAVEWRLANDCATAAFPLEPGGYAVRVETPSTASDAPTFQSVWAAKGWQTLVFVAITEDGLAADRASVHMTRMNDVWQPQSNRRDIDLAVEAARWSLRQGRPGVPPQLLRLLLTTKFRNPMLGIIGAHALLLDAKPNLRQLDEVISNLSHLVRGHPDVRALAWMLEDAKGQRRGTRPAGDAISWPPMLVASYAAAIRRDADLPGAVADGSSAEDVAAHLIVTGIWTSWRRPSEQESGTRASAPEFTPEPDPAEARALEYVNAVADRRGESPKEVLAKLHDRQGALGTGLPRAVVHMALTRLRERAL